MVLKITRDHILKQSPEQERGIIDSNWRFLRAAVLLCTPVVPDTFYSVTLVNADSFAAIPTSNSGPMLSAQKGQ